MTPGGTAAPVRDEIVALLREVTGTDAAWAAAVRPDSRLDGDLRLDSVEVALLGERLRYRYGPGVDLPARLAELDLAQLIAYTVDDLCGYVAGRATPP